jgi:thioesterase domain-containing protein
MKSQTTAILLENYLLKHIPISAALGVKVDSASSQQVILSAPLSNNINHKSTVFGGSLHSVATLACWSLLHVNLSESNFENVQIVISSSEISYLAPVISDFKVKCSMSDTLDWERFQKILQKKGKARIALIAKIFQGSQPCVDYSGVFVGLGIGSKL